MSELKHYHIIHPDAVAFSQKLYTAKQLLKRWPSLTLRSLVEYIDSSCDTTNPLHASKNAEFLKFPVAYYHLGTGYDLYDKKVEYCALCESDESTERRYFRPYKVSCVGSKNRFYVRRVRFKFSDIEEYEAEYPHVKDENRSSSKPVFTVDKSEISGKNVDFVFKHLKAENIAPHFIAYVLYNYCKLKNKTEIGRFFRDRHESDSTCAKHAKRLLDEAKQFKIVI